MSDIASDIIFTAYLDDDVPCTWYTWMINRIKKYEGRLNKPGNKWATLKEGDKIKIISRKTDESTIFSVLRTEVFGSFGEAYYEHGSKMVPNPCFDKSFEGSVTEYVDQLYEKFYSTEDVKKYGVIVVKMVPY